MHYKDSEGNTTDEKLINYHKKQVDTVMMLTNDRVQEAVIKRKQEITDSPKKFYKKVNENKTGYRGEDHYAMDPLFYKAMLQSITDKEIGTSCKKNDEGSMSARRLKIS